VFEIDGAGLKQYCVDGKTACGTDRLKGTTHEVGQMHTLHVYDRMDGICIFSREVGEKTNEIPVAQEILGLLDLRGTVVSFDALNTQVDTIAIIASKKGDYMATLKGNQPEMYREALSYFTPERLKGLEQKEANVFEMKEIKHNRIETRRYYLTKNVSWIVQTEKWAKLKSIIYYTMHTEDINTGKTTDEIHVYTSICLH